MTDDVDAGPDATTNAETAAADATSEDDATSESDDPEDPERRPANVDFGDLSLPQRVFVAAVQNPTRGVVVLGLLAFAFAFYVAFWMEFPRVAALLSTIGAAVTAILLGVYYLAIRVS